MSEEMLLLASVPFWKNYPFDSNQSVGIEIIALINLPEPSSPQ